MARTRSAAGRHLNRRLTESGGHCSPPLAVLPGTGYRWRRHDPGGVLPTRPAQEPPGDGTARAPGVPLLNELVDLNQAIHDAAGQPERFALDQRAPLLGVLQAANAAYPVGHDLVALAAMAGHLAHGIASAQSFRDGNRRTAFFATYAFLRENDLGHLMAPDDRMVVRYLNQLVEDQGRGRPQRVTPQRFADLFTRRLRTRTPPRNPGQ